MATYTFKGYKPTDFQSLGGADYRLKPEWESANDALTFEWTDDDASLDGDNANNEIGNDANQTVVIRDAAGNIVASGKAYIEDTTTYVDEYGNTHHLYSVEINGTLVGYVADTQVQPGVGYTPVSTTNAGSVSYSSIVSATYNSSQTSYIQGTNLRDSIAAGEGNDTVSTGAGADTINGGNGDDYLLYGTGGATQAAGDSVQGGDGNDTIDDESGVQHTYDDTLDGGAGNDQIYAGGGNDLVYGGSGNDWLAGESGNDTIYGQDGNDTIYGGGGNNLLDGGADGDTFFMENGWGVDTIFGGGTVTTGQDRDILDFSPHNASGVTVTFSGWEDGSFTDGTNSGTFDNIEVIVGSTLNDSVDAALDGSGLEFYLGEGNDTLGGGSGDDWAEGGGGNDTLFGAAGNDTLLGGDGNDTLQGGAGNDQMWGGNGSDTMIGNDDADTFHLASTDGADSIYGGEGGADWDTLMLYSAPVTVTWTGWEMGTVTFDGGMTTSQFWEIEYVYGTSFGDTFNATAAPNSVVIDGADGNDTITGSAQADTLGGGAGNDSLSGGGGNDSLSGGDGADSIDGGDGNDSITGVIGQDTIHGGAGADTILGEGDSDLIYGDAGADSINGGSGNDTIYGGSDNDTIVAGSGSNYLDGGDGDDSIVGSTTNGGDTLLGGAGNDTIAAGVGSNQITGGTGNDLITSGGGADTLSFFDGDGFDTITDFDMTDDGTGFTVDQLDLSGLTDGTGSGIQGWEITVTDDGFGNAVLSFPTGGSITLQGIAPATVTTPGTLYSMGVPCLVEGTRIATPDGPRRIEDLRVGDLVRVRDGPPQPVLWHGSRYLGEGQLAKDPRLRPIEISAGTFGNPEALALSGQHCVWMPEGPGGSLVRPRHMALTGWGGARVMNGKRQVTYHHLLLPRHALVDAGGIWVETFWPGPQGMSGLAASGRLKLICTFPNLAPALFGTASVESIYGPRVRPLLPRQRVSRQNCNIWAEALRAEASRAMDKENPARGRVFEELRRLSPRDC